jgi:phospholipase/carboxylesterase
MGAPAIRPQAEPTRTLFEGHHIHVEPGSNPAARPIVLLHGTGGDESDLIGFGRYVAPDATLLGVRGQLLEGGHVTRWFKRHGEGLFDLEDLANRADAFGHWLAKAAEAFGLNKTPLAIGYSNGANMASAVMMRHPGAFAGAVLMRGMNTVPITAGGSLAGRAVLFLNGAHDPLAPLASRAVLIDAMRAAGAQVSEAVTAPGHPLTQGDADAARRFVEGLAQR